ncbi:hypothetical protein Val02_01150 [Virgisporangium aliadipatigenens]|uniref:Uncharacterized protein n=1 Tax=Virgisporangium aliadipatigenens TaxID=741659 RepID=A0A8J3YDP3_9ACTN|nr:hypothetical protein Val02_01150 [Virgisporangium aliadipatigenens]
MAGAWAAGPCAGGAWAGGAWAGGAWAGGACGGVPGAGGRGAGGVPGVAGLPVGSHTGASCASCAPTGSQVGDVGASETGGSQVADGSGGVRPGGVGPAVGSQDVCCSCAPGCPKPG